MFSFFKKKKSTPSVATNKACTEAFEYIRRLSQLDIESLKKGLRPAYSRIVIKTRIRTLLEFNKKLNYCIRLFDAKEVFHVNLFDGEESIYYSDFILKNIEDRIPLQESFDELIQLGIDFLEKYHQFENKPDYTFVDQQISRHAMPMFVTLKRMVEELEKVRPD